MRLTRHLFATTILAGAAALAALPASAAQTAATAIPAVSTVNPLLLVAPIADYKLYVIRSARQLVAYTRTFTAAVKAGDIEKAKKLYAGTRTSYEKIEPVAELFSDLDKAIDSRADDHETGEKSPGFGGFHRLEYALWTEKSLKGMGPVADKLMKDVLDLQKRLGGLTFPPEKVVGGAAVLMEEVAATKISGEENRYSHTDLWDFQANFEGAYKIVELLRPLIAVEHKAFVEKTDANFKAVFNTLAKYKTADGGFETYSKLSDADRKMLAGRVNTLAEDLSQLRGMLGLN